MATDVGRKIKDLRKHKKLTLKELSERTSLSVGFLSQLERGLTTVAIDSLEKISEALGVDLHYFITMPKRKPKNILRSYEQEVYHIEDSRFIHYLLTNNIDDRNLVPETVHILPGNYEEDIETYEHQGEEFVYVLEGILTLYINNEGYQLYPGDSAHISSSCVHNWANHTNKTVKLLTVHTPNRLKQDDDIES